MRLSPVALRFTAANLIAFLVVVAGSFAGPAFVLVLPLTPFVFGLAVAWAASTLRLGTGVSIGFGAARALGMAWFTTPYLMVGFQAMNGDDAMFVSLALLLILNLVAAAVSLLPVAASRAGGRAWVGGVLGFGAGASLGIVLSLLVNSLLNRTAATSWLSPFGALGGWLTTLVFSPFGVAMWLPSIVGGVAVARTTGGSAQPSKV